MSSPAENEKHHSRPSRPHRSYSSATESDDFSLWSDTGDIAEQLADEEDPLRIELDPLNSEGQKLTRGQARGQGKKVLFQHQDHPERGTTALPIDKEAIVIPYPAPRRISKLENILARIMAPGNEEPTEARGLVGKPLLYVCALRVMGEC